jgi:hypothetical protein
MDEDKLRKLAMALQAPNVMQAPAAQTMGVPDIVAQKSDGISQGIQSMFDNYQKAMEAKNNATPPSITLQSLAKAIFGK